MDSPLRTEDAAGLHLSFLHDVVLSSRLQVTTWATFSLAAAVTSCICIGERALSLLLERHQHPARLNTSPVGLAAWRTVMFAMVTTLRLLYMLIAMSQQLGLLATIVTSLSVFQFWTEYQAASQTGAGQSHGKGSGYSPISTNPNDCPTPYDLEMANSPPSVASTWDGNREVRDKARLIMAGITSPASTPFTPQQAGHHHTRSLDPSPIHRRYSAITDPIKKSTNYRRSGSSLHMARGSASKLTPTNSLYGGRRPLFQIGTSGEDDRTSDSE